MRIRQICFLSASLIVGTSSIPAKAQVAPPRVRVSAGVMAGQLLHKVNPIYPVEAKAERISGAVIMRAIVSDTGVVQNLTVISGPETLRQSALDAVRQWTYKPFLLKGNPVEVETTVSVLFSITR